MIAVIQRVNSAMVIADGVESGRIGKGLYILLGVLKGDTTLDADRLADKISKLRIFSDENDKMNLSVLDVKGEIMVVSNFTLGANYVHGNRPDYLSSAAPDEANQLYEYFKSAIVQRVGACQSGVFGAHMVTEMSTDGPVTIVMDSLNLIKGGKK